MANTCMQTKPTLSRREARWSELFQQFRFTWKHKPGKQNIADGLSRIPHLSVANHLILATGTTVMDVINTRMCHAMQLRPRRVTFATPVVTSGPTTTVASRKRKAQAVPTSDADNTDIVEGYKTDPWFAHKGNTKARGSHTAPGPSDVLGGVCCRIQGAAPGISQRDRKNSPQEPCRLRPTCSYQARFDGDHVLERCHRFACYCNVTGPVYNVVC